MAAALKIGHVANVALKDLSPDPHQPRKTFDQKSIEALASNIKERGIQQPLLVINGGKGKLIIKDGERRWKAAKQAKLKTVPVLLTEKDADEVQTRIDQVAVNNLRQSLTKMELAGFLVQLRDVNKLTPNEIAARLEKEGITGMSPSDVGNTMKLLELKPWAQDMVNAGEIEESAARVLLTASDYPPAAKDLEKRIKQAIDWRGRVTARDVTDAVVDAFNQTAIDLHREHSYDNKTRIAHFDWKTACKSCDHLKRIGNRAFCLNAKEFDKKNDEAKAAGLLPGGKKPKAERKVTPKQEAKQQDAKQQDAKAEQRERSLEEKTTRYLHQFLQARLTQDIADKPVLWGTLTDYVALQRPSSYQGSVGHQFHQVAKAKEISCLADMLGEQYSYVQIELRAAIALEAISQLTVEECQMLAHHLYGVELRPIWKVDQAYLDLLQKAELVAICETHCPLPERKKSWSGAKVGELTAAILAKADEIPVSPLLQKVYEDLEPPIPDFDDEDDDEGKDGPERWDDFHDGHGAEDEEGDDE